MASNAKTIDGTQKTPTQNTLKDKYWTFRSMAINLDQRQNNVKLVHKNIHCAPILTSFINSNSPQAYLPEKIREIWISQFKKQTKTHQTKE